MRLLGDLDPGEGAFVLFWLAFFPPALGVVGVALGYEWLGTLWGAAAGLLGGGVVGTFVAKDLVRWRLRVSTALLVIVFLGLFLRVYA